MQLDIILLEKMVIKIFSEMKQRGMHSVPLKTDFYWNVPSESIYDIYNTPSQLDIGQLEEDYKILLYALETDNLVGYNFKNISVIMRYLSEKYPF